jgi:O-antigen/teichoic acid export membrane protein
VELARRVAKNIMYRTLAQIVANVSGLLVTIYLARVLKPEMFGVYSLAISIAMIAISVANLGIDGSISRYVAYFYSKGDIGQLRSYFWYFLKIKLYMVIPVCAALVLLSGHISTLFGNPELKLPIVFASFFVFSTTLSRSLNAFFSGLQKFEYVFIRQTVYEVSRWVFIFLLVAPLLASGAVLSNAIGRLVAFTVLLFFVLGSYRNYVFGSTSKVDKDARAFAGYMSVSQLGARIYSYIDILMVGMLLSTTDAGYYRAAQNLIFIAAGMIAMSEVFLPLFSQLDGKDLENAFKRITRYTSVMSFPLTAAGIYFSAEIMSAIYGRDYLAASIPFSILSVALLLMAYNYLTAMLNAKGRPEISAKIILLSILLNILLNYVLITKIGIGGAAIATVISRAFTIFTTSYFIFQIFSLKIDPTSIVKPFFCATTMLAFLYLLPHPVNIITGILELTAGFVVYLILIFAIKGLEKDDLRYFASLLGLKS